MAFLASTLALALVAAQEETPYLDAALEAANWLTSVAIETEDGLAWPVQVEGEPRTETTLYHGSSGVVLFFLEAHRQTGRDEYLEIARRGADELVARLGDVSEVTLYTGVAGIGFTLTEAWKAAGDGKYEEAARECLARIQEAAIEDESGVRWNDVTDVVSGSAGIGLYLLHASEALEDAPALELARRAGDSVIAAGIPVGEGRKKWRMDPDFPRLMPNFSHGTAGIGYFLTVLYEATGEERYLRAAQDGARYLRSIAAKQAAGGTLIFHSEPGREDLFYLSWCHGPAGTVRFLRTLARATEDEAWLALQGELIDALQSAGIPAERTPGFWNNAGFCCGDAGIADLAFGLPLEEDDRGLRGFGAELLESVLDQSTLEDGERSWSLAEHRVRPEELSTQTGLMQGAAGIGLVLLRAHARTTGGEIAIAMPDDPWSPAFRNR